MKSAEPGTAQGTPTKAHEGTAQGRHPFGCGQGCFPRIQGPFGPGWSFPLKQDLTRESLQVVKGAVFGPGFSSASLLVRVSYKAGTTPATNKSLPRRCRFR